MGTRYPGKVTIEITKNKVVTKIYDQNVRIMGNLINKREDDSNGFSRKTHLIEDRYPDFMGDVDGFFGTDIARHLKDFNEGVHDEQDED